MNIKADKFKSLIAVDKKRRIIKIPNKVMRKQRWAADQDKHLAPNSICIVCNFSYYYKDRGWSNNVKAICHPFKTTSMFPNNIDLHLFSESDFCDPMWMPDIKLLANRSDYEYDFFCYTIDSGQGVRCKGAYALPLIFQVAKESGMNGLLLDYYPKFPRPACLEPEGRDKQVREVRSLLKKMDNIKIERGWFDQTKINNLMNRCKFVIFPNTNDASPRTIPETLLRGKPILVNKNILGGWKYVKENNGQLFDCASDYEQFNKNRDFYYEEIKRSLIAMKERKDDSKIVNRSFLDEYGFERSSKRLAKIINRIEGHKKYRYVAYKEFRSYLEMIKGK
jgi:hypothetical protein